MPEPYTATSEQTRRKACDRIFLYGQGLELPAEICLEIASESLRRSPSNATLAEIMTVMYTILDERDLHFTPAFSRGGRLESFPRLRRRIMLAKSVECRSLWGWIGQGIRRTARLLAVGKTA